MKVIFTETRNVYIAKSPKIGYVSTYIKAFLAKRRVTQKSGNSSVLYRKTKNPKICLYKDF